jgi:hypothetical protein
MRQLLVVGLLIVASSAFGQGNTVSSQDWIEGMQDKLPAALCQEKQYFRQCFRITEKECLSVAENATRMCLAGKKNEIPPVLVQPNDGRNWGRIIGECAGDAFETALKNKRIDSDKCNDVKNWI